MSSPSRIAGATLALHAHLMRAFTAPDWDGAAPGLGDSIEAFDDAAAADRLFVRLYAIEEDATTRNAVPAGRGARLPAVHSLHLELRYLVAAHASDEARAQALLERAWMHLHATPVIPAASGAADLPLPALVHGIPLAEALPLFRALGLPLRPAFGLRLRVSVEPRQDEPAPPTS